MATLEQDDLPAMFRKATFSFDETLAIVWNITLRELPKDAQDPMNILAYLNSESVPESLLHTVHQEPLLQFLDSREPSRYVSDVSSMPVLILFFKVSENETTASAHSPRTGEESRQ